jgi:hypothetical protein
LYQDSSGDRTIISGAQVTWSEQQLGKRLLFIRCGMLYELGADCFPTAQRPTPPPPHPHKLVISLFAVCFVGQDGLFLLPNSVKGIGSQHYSKKKLFLISPRFYDHRVWKKLRMKCTTMNHR